MALTEAGALTLTEALTEDVATVTVMWTVVVLVEAAVLSVKVVALAEAGALTLTETLTEEVVFSEALVEEVATVTVVWKEVVQAATVTLAVKVATLVEAQEGEEACLFPSLSYLANIMLSIPSSSAEIERNLITAGM